MGQERKKEIWELAAEELVRRVRTLLFDHGDAIEKALAASLGKNEAHAQVDQLEHMVRTLEIELWRKGTAADRGVVGWTAKGLKVALAAIGLTVATTTTSLVITQVHEALTAAETQADEVMECVVEDDSATESSAADRDSDATAPRQRTILEHAARPLPTSPERTPLDPVEPLQPRPVVGEGGPYGNFLPLPDDEKAKLTQSDGPAAEAATTSRQDDVGTAIPRRANILARTVSRLFGLPSDSSGGKPADDLPQADAFSGSDGVPGRSTTGRVQDVISSDSPRRLRTLQLVNHDNAAATYVDNLLGNGVSPPHPLGNRWRLRENQASQIAVDRKRL